MAREGKVDVEPGAAGRGNTSLIGTSRDLATVTIIGLNLLKRTREDGE
jgi:hypothetical protein